MKTLESKTNTSPGQSSKDPRARRWPHVLVAIVAIVVVTFCAWSMSQYTQGNDPIAWLTSQPALQTTEEASSGNNQASSADERRSISKEDVEWAIESLSLDGQDVSCKTDDFRVVLKADEGIWVEQTSEDAAQDMVNATARRIGALCQWIRDNEVDAPHVTWITEDIQGYIRMIVAASPDNLRNQGSPADILAQTDSYVIRYGDYTVGVQAGGISQTMGDTPTYPDGNKVDVATTQEGAQQDGSQAGPDSSANSASPASGDRGSSNSSNDHKRVTAASVSVAIDGSPAGGSSYETSVGYTDGMTVYDALAASGASVNARNTQFGIYVAAIDGLAEKEHGSMSGWVYAVNGVEPNTACSNYTLQPGDVVAWTYVNVEY